MEPGNERNLLDDATARAVREGFAAPLPDEHRAHDIFARGRSARRSDTPRTRRLIALAVTACTLAVVASVAYALLPQRSAEPARTAGESAPTAADRKDSWVRPELQPAWAAISDPGTIVHVVARIERQTFEAAPDDYVPPVRVTRKEIWSDPEHNRRRILAQETQPDGSWATTQEELVDSEVWTVYQYGMTSTDGDWEPMNVLRYDAEHAGEGPPDPFVAQADLSEYRAAIATGTATYGGPSRLGETDVYLVCYRLADRWYSSETTVHVSVETDLPVRTDIVRWYITADGVRHLAERGSVTFEVSEALPRDSVPRDTFTLEYPDDIPVITNLTLDLRRAREAEGVKPMWLGREWDGLTLAKEIPYSNYEGEEPLFGIRGHRHGLRAEDASAELGDYARPDFTGPWITLEYGTLKGPNVRVSSVPLIEPETWESVMRYGEMTTLDGRPAMRIHIVYQFRDDGYASGPADILEPAPRATLADYRFLVVNVGPSTVVLQGYGVTDADLERAAGSLEPLH